MEEANNNFKNDLLFLLAVVATVILMGLLTSCRTKYVTVPEVHTEYLSQTDTISLIKTDSVLLHDSVWVSRWVQGDTVYLTKEVYKYGTRWRDRITYKTHTDTLLRADSVSVPYPIEAKLTKSQQRYITIGKYACGTGVVLAVMVAVLAVWWYRKKV